MLDKNHERNATILMVAVSIIFLLIGLLWQIQTNERRNVLNELRGLTSNTTLCSLPNPPTSSPTTPIKLYRGDQ